MICPVSASEVITWLSRMSMGTGSPARERMRMRPGELFVLARLSDAVATVRPMSSSQLETDLIRWAHRYDGYRRIGHADTLNDLYRPYRDALKTTGRVPDGLGVDLLRGWAFLLGEKASVAPSSDEADLDELRMIAATIDSHPDVEPVMLSPLVSGSAETHIAETSKEITAEIAAYLGNYVYALVDPRDGIPFYVGKGVGKRVEQHGLDAAQWAGNDDPEQDASAKIKQINEIRDLGLEVDVWILKRKMTNAEYTAAESTAIDLLKTFPVAPASGGSAMRSALHNGTALTNIVRGAGSENGITRLADIVRDKSAPPLTSRAPLLLITLKGWSEADEPLPGGGRRAGFGFKREWTDRDCLLADIEAVGDAVRCWWKLSPGHVEAAGIEHVVVLYQGVTRALFRIVPGSMESTKSRTAKGERSTRWGFQVEPVTSGALYDDVVGEYGHTVVKKKGEMATVRYWPYSGAAGLPAVDNRWVTPTRWLPDAAITYQLITPKLGKAYDYPDYPNDPEGRSGPGRVAEVFHPELGTKEPLGRVWENGRGWFGFDSLYPAGEERHGLYQTYLILKMRQMNREYVPASQAFDRIVAEFGKEVLTTEDLSKLDELPKATARTDSDGYGR